MSFISAGAAGQHRNFNWKLADTGGGGGPVDPDFANVSLLLHFEGANGSTLLTDSSSYADNKNLGGGALISDAYGGAFGDSAVVTSIRNPAAVQWDGARFGRLTGQVATLEFWFRKIAPENATATPFFFDLYSTAGTRVFAIAHYATADQLGIYDPIGWPGGVIVNYTPAASGWNYCGCVFNANDTVSVYVNGVLVRLSNSPPPGVGAANNARIFLNNGGGASIMAMDELRFTQGVARDVTVIPTAPFPDQ